MAISSQGYLVPLKVNATLEGTVGRWHSNLNNSSYFERSAALISIPYVYEEALLTIITLVDMLANVPFVDVPECESLGFDHVIDAYRQFSGPANLAGKRVISSELGAQKEEVFSQTLPELIWDVNRSIVGSINNMVYFLLKQTLLTSLNEVTDLSWLPLFWVLPKHDLAWLYYLCIPIFKHAWSDATNLGVL